MNGRERARVVIIGVLALGIADVSPAGEPEVPRGRFADVRNTGFGINTGATEIYLCVSPDGLEFYYGVDDRIWVATRADTSQPFGVAKDAQEDAQGIVLNSGTGDFPGSMSRELDELYLGSFREGAITALFVARRDGPGKPFDTLERLGPKVNLPGIPAGSPCISADGLQLYFHRNPTGQADIWFVRRESKKVVFGDENGPDPEQLWFCSTSYDEFRPRISADDRFLFFADWYGEGAIPRPGGRGGLDMWVTYRDDIEDPLDFVEPVNLQDLWPLSAALNTSVDDTHVCISADWPAYGSKIYWVSERSGSQGACDVWEGTWQPIPPLPPRNLTVTPKGGNTVDLVWEPGDGGEPAVGYKVERRTEGNSWVSIADLVSGTEYTDTIGDLTEPTEYCYRVRAVSEHALQSGPSNAPCVTLTPPSVVFRRGNANDDAAVDISDAVSILNWLFLGGRAPGCVASVDTNGDGSADISDSVYLLGFLFLGGPPPEAPFPDCGPGSLATDETLGCATAPLSCR